MSSLTSDITSTDEFDEAVHKLTSSRSPLAELVADPVLLRSITKSSRSRSGRRDDDRKKRDKDKDSASKVLSVVLAEEEREVQNLRSQLLITAEQLKSSMRKTADAETRANTSASREREAQARIQQLEHAKHNADIELSRQSEEIRRYKQRIEDLERQVSKLDGEVRSLERQKSRADETASEAKDALRLFKQSVREERSREEGIEAGRRMGMMRGFSSGRMKGIQEGRQDGFDKGYRRGEKEGRVVGTNEGRVWEKSRALNAFQSYMARRDPQDYDDEYTEGEPGQEYYDEEEYYGDEGDSLRRTKSWAASVSRHSTEQREDEILVIEPSLTQSSSSGRSARSYPGRTERPYYI